MNQDKEQRILALKRAIDSPTTPDYVKENMREMIAILEAPEPPPPPPKPKKIKPKPKPKPPPHPPVCKLTDEQKENILYEFKKRREKKKTV